MVVSNVLLVGEVFGGDVWLMERIQDCWLFVWDEDIEPETAQCLGECLWHSPCTK
jgi:hypothetical protein